MYEFELHTKNDSEGRRSDDLITITKYTSGCYLILILRFDINIGITVGFNFFQKHYTFIILLILNYYSSKYDIIYNIIIINICGINS